MPTYQTLITTLGQAKIGAAIANESFVNLYEIALGDGNGNPVTPDVTQTGLVREVYRNQINALQTDPSNPNWIVTELVVPSTSGGWTVREVGIYDNAGGLIAVGNFPDTYKPLVDEGSSRDLVVRIIMEVSDTAAITLTIDPSVVLATRQWVQDNFSIAFLLPGGTTGEVLRKQSNQDGDVEWYDPTDGSIIIVDIVEENQTLAALQTVVTLSVATTDGASVYVDSIRLRSDEFTVDSTTQLTLAQSYPASSKITIVQNEPNGNLNFLGSANNLSEIAAAGPAAQAAARGHLGVDDLATIKAAIFSDLYPVNEILITRRTGSPDSWLGFGTWERYGEGRTLVSYNAEDSSFNALDKTGGAKTHKLTENELPATNSQILGFDTTGIGHSVDGFSHSDGEVAIAGEVAGPQNYIERNGAGQVLVKNPGGDQAHNNLQPYIVVHMWKRIA